MVLINGSWPYADAFWENKHCLKLMAVPPTDLRHRCDRDCLIRHAASVWHGIYMILAIPLMRQW